ncbi:alpha/beta hydrolase [Candidatus Gracilibacteria bacterium]|nr:alpha/beta hydrolase [Candidatus Gracilibacteria bacterium]NJM88177.1 alpha/beta hydrolase [Hydrococcus sp. RU_2_2]NJP19615.1 alpha/beta hydrolase [Hydrococcus sp. CRU_1_1]NJQ98693.1 alpha/beta hydrolase [Hydrococcus sp. CSU_1_8]
MSLFCLVHGACQGAWVWDLLIPYLEAQGHKTVAMDLPIEDPDVTLSDYVDAVLEALPETEEDVILVGHSMAGTFISLIAARYRVRQLVFIGSLIPHPGVSFLDQCYDEIPSNFLDEAGYKPPEASLFEQFRDEPNVHIPACIGKFMTPDEQGKAIAMEFYYYDCKPDVANWAFSKTRYQRSLAYVFEKFPYKGIPDVKSNYIACSGDRIISPAWQRYAARKRLGVEAIEISSGHYPHLSHPIRLAEVLNAIASINYELETG